MYLNKMNTIHALTALAAGLLAASASLWGQETPFSNTLHTTCSGILVDSGLSAGDYAAGEDATMYLCAETVEDYFVLDPLVVSLGLGDTLRVYDGSAAEGAPLWTWTSNPGDAMLSSIQSSVPGGCLTLHFTSDATDHGNFAFEMSCTDECDVATATVAFAEGNQGCEGADFLAAANVMVPDGVTWEVTGWLIDGELDAEHASPIAVLQFDSAGVHELGVQLMLGGEVTCTQAVAFPDLVQIAPAPTFSPSTLAPTACPGVPVELTAELTPGTYPGAFQSYVDELTQVPDDQSQCLNYEQTLASGSDFIITDAASEISAVPIAFEHSFMGDLTISLQCPNGQSMTLHEQGGGGTFLGEPVDVDVWPDTPGVAYDYAWSPSATNGTWAENAGGTLPPGTYEATGNWSNLNGCPVDGTWTLEICDSWGSDNGFVFGWGLTFEESVVQALDWTNPPVLDATCSGLYWTDSGNVTHCEGESLTFFETEVFSLTVWDSWGCAWSEDVVFTAQTTGCTDPSALNFNPTAACEDGSCTYMQPTCDFLDAPEWADLDFGWYPPEPTGAVLGESTSFDWVLHAPDTLLDEGNPQNIPLAYYVATLSHDAAGLEADWSTTELYPEENMPVCVHWTGTPLAADTFDVQVTLQPYVTVFGIDVAVTPSVYTQQIIVAGSGSIQPGCTYAAAINFNPAANDDDGSCLFTGDSSCAMDGNLDGWVNTSDLLLLLGEFGLGCD